MPFHTAVPAMRALPRWPLLALLAATWLGACSTPAAPGTPGANSALIPRYELLGSMDRAGGTLSPDGRWVAYVGANGTAVSIWIAPIDKPDKGRALLSRFDHSPRSLAFSATGSHLLYTTDDERNENVQVFALDVATGRSVPLSPRGAQARIAGLSGQFPDEVLLEMNDRDHRQFDLLRVNLNTGSGRRLMENAGRGALVTDAQFSPRYAEEQTEDGGRRWLVHEGTAWKAWSDVPQPDALTTQLLGLDAAGRTLYVLDSRGRNTAALYAVDTASGARRLLHADDAADVGGTLEHPVTGTVQAVVTDALRRRWVALDPELAPDLARLEKLAAGGDFAVRSRTRDDRTWLVEIHRADASAKVYFYDRRSGESRLWYDMQPTLAQYDLVPMHTAEITSRDGLRLPSYLSLPPGSDADANGRPERPVPMVLLVHGGPWSRDEYGLDPTHQWLANRGYAVLSVNFRGSTGFGKAFVNAGNGEWGRRMHDDLLDAVQWAVQQGVARPDKVAIMGASYGGYAALAGLTLTPRAFACGVSIVGPSDLITTIEASPLYGRTAQSVYNSRVGDVDTVPGRKLLAERSPLTHVRNIERPLLIAHGGRDPRVKQAESDQIVAAMQASRIPVIYALYPDEGHGFAGFRNRLSFNALTEHFLRSCLGGEALAIGRDFWDSSLTLPVGAGILPPVKAAYTTMRSGR
jgi:dipeptidyl aminopeptidase/acylaminoacyl peptidase